MPFDYDLLIDQVTSNACLREMDKPVIASVIKTFSIDPSTQMEDMAYAWSDQMDAESAMVYLLSVYGDVIIRYSSVLDRMEATTRLQIPERDEYDRKLTVPDREARIIIDAKVQEIRKKLNAVTTLIRDLNNLFKRLIGRNEKLDNINVDLRRQHAVDVSRS